MPKGKFFIAMLILIVIVLLVGGMVTFHKYQVCTGRNSAGRNQVGRD